MQDLIVILSVVAVGLFVSSVVGWCMYATKWKVVHNLQAKVRAYERQHQQDVARIAQHAKRLDLSYEATRGYVPSNFDPDTKA